MTRGDMSDKRIEQAVLRAGGRDFEPLRELATFEDQVAYLQIALEDFPDDAQCIAHILGQIAKAQGMSDVARKSDLGRTALYKSLSGEVDPNLSTVLKVIKAIGLKLQMVPA